jgi:hypothetical protein
MPAEPSMARTASARREVFSLASFDISPAWCAAFIRIVAAGLFCLVWAINSHGSGWGPLACLVDHFIKEYLYLIADAAWNLVCGTCA